MKQSVDMVNKSKWNIVLFLGYYNYAAAPTLPPATPSGLTDNGQEGSKYKYFVSSCEAYLNLFMQSHRRYAVQ